MTFLITCPNCGPREALEFAFGGETTRRAGPDGDRSRARRRPVLPPQRRRLADGMVGPPERLPGVVPRRAAHDDERDPPHLSPTEEPGGRARVSERLPERQGEAIRRDRPIRFRFERRTIAAFEGDTVGSALAAAGVTITAGRSSTTGRAVCSCMTGSCPNCLMQIDGIPNVRACTEPVREGMTRGTPERVALGRPRHPRMAEHVLVHDAARLLLQDLPAPALGVAARRAVHPVEGRAREGAARAGSPAAAPDQPPPRRPRDRSRGRRPRRGGGRGGGRAHRSSCSSRAATPAATCWARRAAAPRRDSPATGAGVGNVRFLPDTAAFGVFGGGLVAPPGGRPLSDPRATRDLRDRGGRGIRRVPRQRSPRRHGLVGRAPAAPPLRRAPRPPGGGPHRRQRRVLDRLGLEGRRRGGDRRRPSLRGRLAGGVPRVRRFDDPFRARTPSSERRLRRPAGLHLRAEGRPATSS